MRATAPKGCRPRDRNRPRRSELARDHLKGASTERSQPTPKYDDFGVNAQTGREQARSYGGFGRCLRPRPGMPWKQQASDGSRVSWSGSA
jgi:hypothetical protein